MGLATTLVQIKKFGWSSGNIAAFVVGMLSLVFTTILSSGRSSEEERSGGVWWSIRRWRWRWQRDEMITSLVT
jgi:hypothetical protein